MNTYSETGSEVVLIGLWEYIAVRCLTGWTGWILDIYIFPNTKNPNPHWNQAVPEASICITQQMCHTFLHDCSMVKDERKKISNAFFLF
jgi:hypothetical protein